MISDADEPVGFETHVKPMFRERDRESMQSHFDLSSHDDVSQHADAILARLPRGRHGTHTMRVCIVGASGKLGQYMVRHALGRGYDVVGVCREESAAADRGNRSWPTRSVLLRSQLPTTRSGACRDRFRGSRYGE